ncbi:MAG TPA: hypothetical protein VFR76_15000 [Verrucomicrobiae bacterium]|nr:hypothetical protein [Verrucomicrobiae bacterium]
MSAAIRRPLLFAAFAIAALCSQSAHATITNAILFVTQAPIPDEVNDGTVSNVFVSVVSALGNHLADTAHAGRGGDLWIRYPGGALTNLTRAAGFGTNTIQHGIGIGVRDPFMHWSGKKAVFSMVVGAPADPGDTNQYSWQLYEITNFVTQGSTPSITKVPNQPTHYNNVMPCYGTDERVIFACDRPRDGSAHLYPQLDEYNNVPSNTGLWSLDPATGDLFQLDHCPSGDFNPFVDSFGRVIFTRWDHLVQDRNATDDRMSRATNGTFNYFDEAATNYDITYRPNESFPEPRSYDTELITLYKVQGNALNSFFPWMQNEDGTGLEILNHVGRHELLGGFRGSSFTNDNNLVQQFSLANRIIPGTNFLNNFLHIREDPLHPGSYFGIDAPDFGTHSSGQILKLFGPPGTNGEQMTLTHITPVAMKGPTPLGLYRNPLPMANGTLVAAYASGTAAADSNLGSAAFPKSAYWYRLVTLTNTSSGIWTNESFLMPAFTNVVSYWSGNTLVTHTNGLWALSPVEVVSNKIPARLTAPVAPIEAQVFAEEGVDLPVMQSWLRSNNLALLVSRNVTARDRADREQPFNLRVPVPNGAITTNNSGKIYDIAYIQFLQADQLRGLTFGTTNPVPGRRVLAMPMHDFAATNFNVPVTNGLVGATQLGPDGSQATFVPARRAMSHQTVDPNGNHVVRERYWITYQPGEIRTCAVCHGLNVADQAGRPLPTNPPAALRDLLRHWKSQTGYTKILSGTPSNGVFAANVSGPTTRATVLEATSDFQQWTPVATNNSSSNGIFLLSDPAMTNHPYRFYRGRVP